MKWNDTRCNFLLKISSYIAFTYQQMMKQKHAKIFKVDMDQSTSSTSYFYANSTSLFGRQHNLLKRTFSYHNENLQQKAHTKNLEMFMILKGIISIHLWVIMYIVNQEKTSASSYIMPSPLNLKHMSIIIFCLVLFLLIKIIYIYIWAHLQCIYKCINIWHHVIVHS